MISFNSHKGALFAILVACGVAAVACAESDGPSDLLQGEVDDGDAGTSTTDGGTQLDPTTDASDDGNVDVGVDASVDAGTDAAPAPKLCTVHGWCHTLLPSSQKLRDVWGDGTGIVWAVSEEGNILRYDGTSWTIAYTNTAAVPGPLYAI